MSLNSDKPFPDIWRLTYPVKDAAERLGYPQEKLRSMIRAGEIKSFRWAGRTLIRADVLEDFIEERERTPPSPPPSKPAPLVPASGVYLLFQSGALTYIGRSSHVRNRIAAHRQSGRAFDEARVIPCDIEAAGWLEAELIRVLRPPENIRRFERRARLAALALSKAGLA